MAGKSYKNKVWIHREVVYRRIGGETFKLVSSSGRKLKAKWVNLRYHK